MTTLAPDFTGLVQRIRNGSREAIQDLYLHFSRGIKFLVRRKLLGSERVEDVVHEVFVAVLEAIQEGRIREPERLAGFVNAVLRCKVAEEIADLQLRRGRDGELSEQLGTNDASIESDLVREDEVRIATQLLKSMNATDREVLVRFYQREQSAGSICVDMRLTETQFRNLKHRAKAKLVKKLQASRQMLPMAVRK